MDSQPIPPAVRLRVLFMINVNGNGVGGHYRSLRTTVEALSKTCDCLVVCIGRRTSAVLEDGNFSLRFVYATSCNLFASYRELERIVRSEKPDVINSFDTTAHFFGRVLGLRFKLPVVHTKCGGPNPRRYFPLADGLIVYSHENLHFFEGQARFRELPRRFISNRVQPFVCDNEKVEALRARLLPGVPCFLRVNRFSEYYEMSMMQCIALVKRMNTEGYRAQLVFVGGVQDEESFERVRNASPANVHFITDEQFTHDAKLILDVADFVVGTGRGLMEAACRGKVLLTPLKGADYPLLVTQENVEQLLHTNFSERNRVDNVQPENNYQEIVRAMKEVDERDRLGREARFFFDRYFNIDNAVATYHQFLISTPRRAGLNLIDLALHGWLAVSHMYKTRHLNGA